MSTKPFAAAAGLLATAVLAAAAAALAQTTAPVPAEARTDRFLTERPVGALRGSKLVGVDVIGADNVKIGDIDEILVDPSGRVQAVVIGVGGFLGLGEKSVAIPFDMLLWNTGDVSRALTPSASTVPGTAAAERAERGATGDAAARMPGANVNQDVLGVTVSPGSATGNNPVRGTNAGDAATATTGATGSAPATVPVVDGDDGPERAVVPLTKADLERAPAFHYDAAAARRSAPR